MTIYAIKPSGTGYTAEPIGVPHASNGFAANAMAMTSLPVAQPTSVTPASPRFSGFDP